MTIPSAIFLHTITPFVACATSFSPRVPFWQVATSAMTLPVAASHGRAASHSTRPHGRRAREAFQSVVNASCIQCYPFLPNYARNLQTRLSCCRSSQCLLEKKTAAFPPARGRGSRGRQQNGKERGAECMWRRLLLWRSKKKNHEPFHHYRIYNCTTGSTQTLLGAVGANAQSAE